MKIAKLLTWNWGSLEDREWIFADTVLLTGESGSGKSTLLDAIQTVLTAAHQHLVQFNIGQDESTQSRRGGKEPRTLAQGEYLQTPAQLGAYEQFSSCINCLLCYAACPQIGLKPDFAGPAALALMQYLKGEKARGIIKSYGYSF